MVVRVFPHTDDGSKSEEDDFENQTGCENVDCDTKFTSLRCGAQSSPVEGGEPQRSSNQQREKQSTEDEDDDQEAEQSKRRRLQPNALDDSSPSPLLNGSLGASPGRVERFSALQLIGHGPEQQDEEDEWEQACCLQAEFDEGNWETIDSDPPTQAQSNLTFQAAKKFDGQRLGMEF